MEGNSISLTVHKRLGSKGHKTCGTNIPNTKWSVCK